MKTTIAKLVALAALSTPLSAQTYAEWRVELVALAYRTVITDDAALAFNAAFAHPAGDGARVSLDVFGKKAREELEQFIRTDKRFARAVLASHYTL